MWVVLNKHETPVHQELQFFVTPAACKQTHNLFYVSDAGCLSCLRRLFRGAGRNHTLVSRFGSNSGLQANAGLRVGSQDSAARAQQ